MMVRMKKLRCIQVGLGVRGQKWAEVMHPHPAVEITAYVDTRLEWAREVVASWQESTPCFATLEEALQSVPAEIVVLVTPPDVHYEQCMTAFQHQCHVLCEKPLTEDYQESITLVQEAEQRGLYLMVGHNFRYLPVHQRLRQMLLQEELGESGFGQFTYLRNRDGNRSDLNKYPLTMHQPMLLEQSIHHIDLMRFCYGEEITHVQADTWRPSFSTYAGDCCVSAMFHFESGFRLNYLGTWTSGHNRFHFEWRTDCSNGVIIQKQQFEALYQATLTAGLAIDGELFKSTAQAEPLYPIPIPKCRAFYDDTRGLFDEFVAAILHAEPLLTSGMDHLKTLGVTLAVDEAAASGQTIEMKSFYQSRGVPEAWL
jgi:predicted dehydrogenase